jgi:hypothetical protein
MEQTKDEFLSIDDAATEIGWNRVTIFQWIKTLEMETKKFLRNRKTYISRVNVDRIKQIKAKPWIAEAIKEEIAQEKKSKEIKPEESVA